MEMFDPAHAQTLSLPPHALSPYNMGKDVLIKLLSSRGLETSGSKDKMVEAVITHEANIRQELKAFETKAIEAAAQKKKELEKKSGAELKDYPPLG